MIYVTGDTHSDFGRFSTKRFRAQRDMTKNDYVIICGDFGGVWNGSKTENYWLDWLQDKPFTTLFVDGNHENFDMLNALPTKRFAGGDVHVVRDNILHLMRGNVYVLQNKTFFTFGGASSHDMRDGVIDPAEFPTKEAFVKYATGQYMLGKQFRIKGISWWPDELPTKREMERGVTNLLKHGNTVDYVITHCAPQSIASVMSDGFYKMDALTNYLNNIYFNTTFNHWFCGHYHIEGRCMGNFDVLYESIIRIV